MPVPTRALLALSLLAIPATAVASAKSEAVRRLIDDGRLESAQARCNYLRADISDTPKELREVCAEAMFEAALQENRVMTWIKFQQVWTGTSYAAAARDNEAAAALRDLGMEAKEYEYAQFIRQYRDTKYALAAQQMLGDAAIRDVTNGKDAVRVAMLYPDHRSTPHLVEKFLMSFLKMEMNGLDVKVRIEPDVKIPGPPPTGRWAAKYGEESYLDWTQAAGDHLKDLGVNPTFIDAAKSKGVPPCQVPESGWELGVLVEVGSGKAFFPNGGVKECRGRVWPAFTVYNRGRLSALSLAPDSLLQFPTDGADGWFPWGMGEDAARMWTPGAAGDPILVGGVIGQPVGNLFLLTPIAGGMPWFVSQGPPPTAMRMPVEARSTAIPLGWEVNNSSGPLGPGEFSSMPATVSSGALAGAPWMLPPGEVRVVSPIVQQITGLTRFHAALEKRRKSRLPILTGTTGPMGSIPVNLKELSPADGEGVGRQLASIGIPVRVWRAWEGNLGNAMGSREVAFDGEIGGTPVKGVLDPMENSSGFRAYVWLRDERAQNGPEDVFSFQLDGATYLVWKGNNGNGDYNEAIHFDDTGLVREFR